MRTAGEGNFTIINDVDDKDWDDEEDWDEEDGMMDDEPESTNLPDTLSGIDSLYNRFIRTDEGKVMLENSTIGKAYELTKEPVERTIIGNLTMTSKKNTMTNCWIWLLPVSVTRR